MARATAASIRSPESTGAASTDKPGIHSSRFEAQRRSFVSATAARSAPPSVAVRDVKASRVPPGKLRRVGAKAR